MKNLPSAAILALAALLVAGAPAGASPHENRETNDRAGDLRQLLIVEGATEAIAEGEASGAAGRTAAQKGISTWPAVRTTLLQNGAARTDVRAVDRAIDTLRIDLASQAGMRRSANEVTGALAPLFAIAGDPVPANVHRLDYLGRSIAIDAVDRNWSRARADSNVLQQRWTQVRPAAMSHSRGPVAVTQFDRAVSAERAGVTSRSVTATVKGAALIGNAVDALENI